MIIGKSFIGNNRSSNKDVSFQTFNPILNKLNVNVFFEASESELEKACALAKKAFYLYRESSDENRKAFLNEIKVQLINSKAEILDVYMLESGLSVNRAEVEFARTVFQIESFVQLLEKNNWKNESSCTAPKKLNSTKIPLGVVAVFGASNFPLAYSTAGGDTISALAAGCPVIVKSHPMHAGTGELVAKAIVNAAKITQMPDGVFSNLNSKDVKIGAALVRNEHISAVGFTGSINGGRAIYNIAAERHNPIPVFAEMGSLNPVFLMNDALALDAVKWADNLAKSITNDGGQFCTKPGIIIGLKSVDFDGFKQLLSERMKVVEPSYALHPDIKKTFVRKIDALIKTFKANVLFQAEPSLNQQSEPVLLNVLGREFIATNEFREEVFGPFSLVVECASLDEMHEVIKVMDGQLTGTIIGLNEESIKSGTLYQNLMYKVGRIILNDVPTGVQVTETMNHGGPYPASSDARFTAVGVNSIQRWVRTICMQN